MKKLKKLFFELSSVWCLVHNMIKLKRGLSVLYRQRIFRSKKF